MTLPPLPRPFWSYLSGMAAAALGDALLYVTLPFITLRLTPGGATGAVGAVVLAGTLPRFLGPLLGSVADRTPPHQVFLGTSLIRALVVMVTGLLLWAGHLPLTGLLMLAFLNGTMATLAYTAGSAFVPRLVTADQLPRANSLSSGAMMGLPLIGYGLGATLLHLLGNAGALLCGAPLFLLFSMVTVFLPHLPAAATSESMGLLADLKQGWAVLRDSRLLLSLLSLSFTLNLAMNIMNVRSPLHMRDFGRGAPDYAVFEMLISGGVLLGVLLVTPFTRKYPLDSLIGAGRWVLVVGMTGFLWTPIPTWWVAAAVFGCGLGLLEVAAVTRSQQIVPTAVRGRVLGALMSVNAVGLSLGAALASLPLPTTLLMGGLAGTLLILALVWPFTVNGASTTQ